MALLVMALWGSLYPSVKIGYRALSIASTDIPNILMFAGTRFVLSGGVMCVFAFFKKEKLADPKWKSIGTIMMTGLFSIVLHYTFMYMGLSSTDSSKTAIIKQLGSLLYICVAFLFFQNEKFSAWKIIGALVGFAGIIAINFRSNGISFSSGDWFIILSSFCSVTSSILGKKIVVNNSPFWLTGISQLTGGVVLVVSAFIMGAKPLNFQWDSFAIFLYICTASTVSYALWYQILKTSDLSNMFLIKFAEPLFACVFSAILLDENIFQWQYFIAFTLIATGIILGNKKKREKTDESKNL